MINMIIINIISYIALGYILFLGLIYLLLRNANKI